MSWEKLGVSFEEGDEERGKDWEGGWTSVFWTWGLEEGLRRKKDRLDTLWKGAESCEMCISLETSEKT